MTAEGVTTGEEAHELGPTGIAMGCGSGIAIRPPLPGVRGVWFSDSRRYDTDGETARRFADGYGS